MLVKTKFSALCSHVRNESEHDKLEEKFALYQCDAFSEAIINGSRIDVNWGKIGDLRNEIGQVE